MDDLFDQAGSEEARREAPLADRMRPRKLEEFVGQEHLVGPDKFLREIYQSGKLPSLIFWGPPGSGKTTLARMLTRNSKAHFLSFSAVLSGVAELRKAIEEAEQRRKFQGQKTVLFVDEIHRWNKAQQDAFLPHVETGRLILIGATTQNPSFEVIPALLSRCRVCVLNFLSEDDIARILAQAVAERERGLFAGEDPLLVEEAAVRYLARVADGDARRALNALELAASLARAKAGGRVTEAEAKEALSSGSLLYDKAGEEHYNLISAFIKSLRGSDPDAALYWMVRMLESGEDPLFLLRRMVIFAAEDIGNADPMALQVAVAAQQAFSFVGLPEGRIPMAQAVTYLAGAPKSNASYAALGKAAAAVREAGSLPVPEHLRNPVTGLMEALGYGHDYKYPHDYPGHHVRENYLPEKLRGTVFYEPSEQGEEIKIKARLSRWREGVKKEEDDPGESGGQC
ncbi:MAG: AAA family ATPase [Deltaproteobacteria bacterium RBG_13_61_14]|nr:MAG: AAA family ATPase [Deltaproteobacteria bacterium RBG_13_61_14]